MKTECWFRQKLVVTVRFGELITHNARVFENIPLTIDYKGHFEIEGEAIITYDDFNKINEPLSEDKKYKNPRNLASRYRTSVRQQNCSKKTY